ncbi:MAG: hypothetical protein ACREDS_05360, partial [Limisphaerales bacterium]
NEFGGTVGEYTTSGATINASLISGLSEPCSIAVSGTNLFVSDLDTGTVGEYTTSGATVNASLISGLGWPIAISISGTNLFVVNQTSDTVGEYTSSGATVNASLISGLFGAQGIAISSPVPQLNIATIGNQNVLFYPAWATNYVLQSTTNLASTNWITVSNAVPVIAVTVSNQLPTQFFRLMEQ